MFKLFGNGKLADRLGIRLSFPILLKLKRTDGALPRCDVPMSMEP